MAYQVIARKYRPQRFVDVIGQEHVTQTLANAIQQNRIAHAYLFCGPRGTGKTTTARIFAKALNCTGGPKVDFDEQDPRCVEIAEGRSLDVLEIDGASNNGVEQVRDLRETCKYAPATSTFKIYIIDEVHMLSTAAFNALLKTLEEPPAHVKFLFATTDPEKVLPTILSRCQRFDLRRIPVPLITEHLTTIARQENVEIEPAALHAIARGADGGMRDAESALDQLISFCGNTIVENDVLSMFGLTGQSQIVALAGAVLAGNAELALRELDGLAKQGKDLGRLLPDLLNHFRNLLVFQVSKGDLSLLEVSEIEKDSLAQQAKAVSPEAMTRVMEVFTDAEGRWRDTASKKILFEVTLLRAIQARNAVSIDAVLKQLNQLRQGDGAAPTASGSPVPAPAPSAATRPTASTATPGPAPRPAPPASSAATPVPTAAPSAAIPSVSSVAGSAGASTPPAAAPAPTPVEGLEGLWSQVLEAVGRASQFTRSYLLQAHPVAFEKNALTIGFDPEFEDQIELVNNAKTVTLLQTKLQELGHPGAQIKFVKAEAPASRRAENAVAAETTKPANPAVNSMGTAAPTPAAPVAPPVKKEKVQPIILDPSEFKNDPLIQKALEIFKGTIIEVRA